MGGTIVDLRKAQTLTNEQLEENDGSIFLVNFTHPVYVTMQEFATKTAEAKLPEPLNVIIDHGRHTRRQHFVYAVMEDPHFNIIVQVKNSSALPLLKNGNAVTVESTGVQTWITAASTR